MKRGNIFYFFFVLNYGNKTKFTRYLIKIEVIFVKISSAWSLKKFYIPSRIACLGWVVEKCWQSLYFFLSCLQKKQTMRAVIQRVSSASVTVDNKLISEIGRGLVCLIGICEGDTTADADWMLVENIFICDYGLKFNFLDARKFSTPDCSSTKASDG